MKNMTKKIISLVIVILCVVSLTGCSAAKKKLTVAEKVKDTIDYLEMNGDELLELTDPELYDACVERINEKIADCEDIDEIRATLTDEEFAFYTVNRFKSEVEDGGIKSIFDGDSDDLAPLVSECLDIIGAEEHKDIYDSFVAVNDFASEHIPGLEDGIVSSIISGLESFTSDEFDEKFDELPGLEENLQDYARENIDNF